MTKPTMTEVQTKLPWVLGYSSAFQQAVSTAVRDGKGGASTMAHLDFEHAILHVVKATGKLAAMCENADHNRRTNSEVCAECHAKAPDMVACRHISNTVTRDRRNLTDFPLYDVDKCLADIVICAMRAANVRPGGSFDLWTAVLRRIDEKNGSNLAGGKR